MTSVVNKLALYVLPIFVLIFSACSAQPPAAGATFTPDPDPCSPQNLPASVEGINALTREFDETSQQVSNSSQELPEIVADLQRIRREAEDLPVPDCLSTLKTHQLKYMNLAIQVLLSFLANPHPDILKNGLEIAQQEQNLYSLEMVRLLGITLAPVTESPPPSP